MAEEPRADRPHLGKECVVRSRKENVWLDRVYMDPESV